VALSPGYAQLRLWFGWHLIMTGRTAEGISQLQEAESLDPLSQIIGADLADALCIARRFDESEQQARKTLELDANFAVGHYVLGQTLLQKGKTAESIGEFEQAIALAGNNGAFNSNLGYAYAVAGRRAEAQRIVGELTTASEANPSADVDVALVHVGLGDLDGAMAWLERAYYARFNPSILLRPAWDPLRADPRFKELWQRLDLPA
jgi:Flp pilus assembly protein TadD